MTTSPAYHLQELLILLADLRRAGALDYVSGSPVDRRIKLAQRALDASRITTMDAELILAQCAGRVPHSIIPKKRARQEATAQDARAIGLPEALAKPQQ